MVDGDQLNVIVDPLFVEVAQRNVQKYDIVPLFYDAEKANAEPITKESIFNGLKRAHEYSNIGEISNMLTRVWNKDKPDRVVAALLAYLNNMRIDGAKTGIVHEYADYPQIAKRIGRATGGRNARMPYWFQFSKNQRSEDKKDKKYLEPNNSTMNRICAAFNDIGNINMNYAGVPPFNWQMLLSEPCTDFKPEIPELFCRLDNTNIASIIESRNESYSDNREMINGYVILAEDIVERLTEKFGSLEYVYPYIVKYLFAGEGMKKAAHKQMFWRIFGDIALRNIQENLKSCDKCEECNMKIPDWAEDHICVNNSQGFYTCIDCGAVCERTNSKQCRCPECQDICTRMKRRLRQHRLYHSLKDEKKKRITRLQSS